MRLLDEEGFASPIGEERKLPKQVRDALFGFILNLASVRGVGVLKRGEELSGG